MTTMRSACVKAIIAVAAILFGLPPYALSQPTGTKNPAESDSTLTVSLLTAAPGDDIYELEGHAALRLKSSTYDMTVNWGLFDFDSPNFVYRFVKGETDYMAGAIPTAYFIEQYRREGRRLKEQTFNLTPEEAGRLRELVEINLLPENRTYRYNYVRDNCSTRCIDIVERAIGDSVYLGAPAGELAGNVSFRDMMAYHHRNYPWYQFGIDLALGNGIDHTLTNRQKAFAPTVLECQAEQALRPDGTPLTLGTDILVAGDEHGTALAPTPWWITPLAVCWAIFAVVISLTVADINRGSVSRWLDSLLFGAMGLTGCVIAFLIFISVHEATSPNWLILWLNPLCFIPAILEWSRRCRAFLICYHFVNFAAILTMTILMTVGEQNCNSAFIPLIACSALRSTSYIYISLCGKRKELTYSIKILCAVLLTLVTASAGAQTAPKRPQMVVGIMVEGLSQDYLDLLHNHFTDGGFKRLMRDGATLSNVDYGPGVDAAAATAIIYTGAAPSVNGIPAEYVYDRERRRSRSILLDTAKIGNFTNETYSPAAILVSTLGDEVRLDAAGTGWVYSVAPDPAQAIIMTGHAGNSGFWINDHTGSWATTTHYKDVPRSISSRNYRRPISTVLDTLKWEPLLTPAQYPDIPDYKRQYPFRHYFGRKDVDRYRQYKASAKANEEVTSIAEEYLSTMALGTRGPVDMVNIGYTLSPYPYTADGDNRMETIDAYLRLDRDLARLMKAIDHRTGAGNSLIFLAGYPARPTSRRDDEKWGLPSGEFSPRKAISLLNMYLIALHGNGDWVTGYFNRNFYLNQRLIKENRLDASDVRAEAAEFLARMSGVSGVYTIDDIIASRAGDNANELKRNTLVKYAGDVVVNITPGWSVTDDTVSGAVNAPQVAREAFFPSTVIVMGPGVKPQTIDEKIDARRIAPTVCRLLRIRSPGAASLPAVRL